LAIHVRLLFLTSAEPRLVRRVWQFENDATRHDILLFKLSYDD